MWGHYDYVFLLSKRGQVKSSSLRKLNFNRLHYSIPYGISTPLCQLHKIYIYNNNGNTVGISKISYSKNLTSSNSSSGRLIR